MTWIQTMTGQKFHLLNPDPGTVQIEDIAHALSNLCRFTGHSNKFYSVAQHSCLLSEAVEEYCQHNKTGMDTMAAAFQALMHDAAEAYLGDCTGPLKAMLPKYQLLETGIEMVIATKFGLDYPFDPLIKNMDSAIMLTESGTLMGPPPDEWEASYAIKPLDVVIEPWSPEMAREAFTTRFDHLFEWQPVRKKEAVRCVNCDRERLNETEGRFILGDWEDDRHIPQHYGKWVCGHKCYVKLVERMRVMS